MLTVDEAARTSLKYWSKTPLSAHGDAAHVIRRSGKIVRCKRPRRHHPSELVLRPWSPEGKRIETIVPRDPISLMDVGLASRRNAPFTPTMEAFRAYFRQTFFIPTMR